MHKEKSLWHRTLDVLLGYDFFISYAYADGGAYAEALANALRTRGFQCFLDRSDYSPGDHWKIEGKGALRRTTQLLVVASTKAFHSEAVLYEVRTFSALNRRIVPIEFGANIQAASKLRDCFAVHIAAEVLRLNEPEAALKDGPTEHLLQRLVAGFRVRRQQQKRINLLKSSVAILGFLLICTTLLGIYANASNRQSIRRLAQVHFASGAAKREAERDSILATHHLLAAARSFDQSGLPTESRIANVASALQCPQLLVTVPHLGRVTGVSSSADEHLAAAWTEAGEVTVFDATTGRLRLRGQHPHGAITGACFSPECDRLVLWSKNGTLALWTLKDPAPECIWITNGFPANEVQFSHTAKALIALYNPIDDADDRNKVARWRIWNAKTGKAITPIYGADGIAVSPNSDVFHAWKDRLHWTLSKESGTAVANPSDAGFHIDSVIAGPESRNLLFGNQKEGVLRVWNVPTSRWSGSPIRFGKAFDLMGFACNGTNVFARDGVNLKIWNATSSKPARPPAKAYRFYAMAPKAISAVVAVDEKGLNVAQVDCCGNGPTRAIEWLEGNAFTEMNWESGILVSAMTDWRTSTEYLFHRIDEKRTLKEELVLSCREIGDHFNPVFSADGKWVITYSDGGYLDVRRTGESGVLTYTRLNAGQRVQGAKFLLLNRRILHWGNNGCVRLWSTGVGDRFGDTNSGNCGIQGVEVSPDGTLTILQRTNGLCDLWQMGHDGRTSTFKTRLGRAVEAAFCGDSSRVIVGRTGGIKDMFDAQSGKLLYHSVVGGGLDLQLPSKREVSGYRLARAAHEQDMPSSNSSNAANSSDKLPFQYGILSADGLSTMTYSNRGGWRLWDAQLGIPITPIIPTGAPREFDFSSDGKIAAMVDEAGKLSMFYTKSGVPVLCDIPSNIHLSHLDFSGSGQFALLITIDDNEEWNHRVLDLKKGRILGPPFIFPAGNRRRAVFTKADDAIVIEDAQLSSALHFIRRERGQFREVKFDDDVSSEQWHKEDRPVVYAPRAGRLFLWRGSYDGASLLDMRSGNAVGKPFRFSGQPNGAGFSNDELLLWTWDPSEICVWRSDSAELIMKWNRQAFLLDGDGTVTVNNGSIVVSSPNEVAATLFLIPQGPSLSTESACLEFEVRSATKMNDSSQLESLSVADWEQRRAQLENDTNSRTLSRHP